MSSETKKTSESKTGCAEWGQMSGMYTDMMKMMEKCCPGMKERFSNEFLPIEDCNITYNHFEEIWNLSHHNI